MLKIDLKFCTSAGGSVVAAGDSRLPMEGAWMRRRLECSGWDTWVGNERDKRQAGANVNNTLGGNLACVWWNWERRAAALWACDLYDTMPLRVCCLSTYWAKGGGRSGRGPYDLGAQIGCTARPPGPALILRLKGALIDLSLSARQLVRRTRATKPWPKLQRLHLPDLQVPRRTFTGSGRWHAALVLFTCNAD